MLNAASHGPRFPDRPVRGLRAGDDPPDVFRVRDLRRRHQFCDGAARWSLFPRRRTNHPAIRGRGIKAVPVPDPEAKTVTVNSYWQLPARLYDDPEELADWARAALVGRATRGAAQASEGEEDGSQEMRRTRKKAMSRRRLVPKKRPHPEKFACVRRMATPSDHVHGRDARSAPHRGAVTVRRPGCESRRRIPDRLRRSRGCGRCAWRHRGRHRRVRSASRCRRRASASKRRPRW